MRRGDFRPILLAIIALATVASCDLSERTSKEESERAVGSGEGPLAADVNPHGWAVAVKPRHTFTDGLEILRLTGDEPAVIEDISLVADEGLTLVDSALLGPSRPIGGVQFVNEWPPVNDPDIGKEPLLPLHTPITPITEDPIGWELLLALRAERPGRFERAGIKITYTVGGRRYSTLRPAKLAVCATPTPETTECEPPEE